MLHTSSISVALPRARASFAPCESPRHRSCTAGLTRSRSLGTVPRPSMVRRRPHRWSASTPPAARARDRAWLPRRCRAGCAVFGASARAVLDALKLIEIVIDNPPDHLGKGNLLSRRLVLHPSDLTKGQADLARDLAFVTVTHQSIYSGYLIDFQQSLDCGGCNKHSISCCNTMHGEQQ